MKKQFLSLLLGIALCLSVSGTAVAADSGGTHASGQVGGSSITVSIHELKPGYYLCAVWDGDELLTLFDTTVGSDGILNETVEIGKTLVSTDSLTVGVSGANTNSTDVVYPVILSGSGESSSGWNSGGGGGGGSSSTSGNVTVKSTSNGRVTVSPGNPRKGDTVTITVTPNSGYELDKLMVKNSKGNAVSLKDQGDGKYTFTMPDGKVTVDAAFVKVNFLDVQPGVYYYDAVTWAVEQGVTAGTSATTFSPDSPCTRAQIVTFLWRAAGSPVVGGDNPFTDVASNAYYYDAVAWAVANGITAGTSANAFSPNATCTRGQAVTFLYRTANSPAAGDGNPFGDVDSGAYYADAVQWAVGKGVTVGTSTTTFSPNSDCTRAQIVTFLYRDRAN